MPTAAAWVCTASWKAKPQPRVFRSSPRKPLQKVKDTLAQMLAGEFTRFDVFSGPIKDNQGKVVVPEGEKMEQADLDQFPPGAEGSGMQVLHEVVG